MREKAKRLAREEEEEESKNETPQPKSFQKKGLQRTYTTIGALSKRASVIQVGVIQRNQIAKFELYVIESECEDEEDSSQRLMINDLESYKSEGDDDEFDDSLWQVPSSQIHISTRPAHKFPIGKQGGRGKSTSQLRSDIIEDFEEYVENEERVITEDEEDTEEQCQVEQRGGNLITLERRVSIDDIINSKEIRKWKSATIGEVQHLSHIKFIFPK